MRGIAGGIALAVGLLCAGPAPAQAPAGSGTAREAAMAKSYSECMALARSDPAKAVGRAAAWEREGGDEGARHCAAVALLNSGEYEEAARRLESLAATTHKPGTVVKSELYAQAGQAWLIAGKAEEALAVQTKALEIGGPQPELLIDRAITRASLGRYFEAIDDLNEVLDRDGGRVDALVLRATAWRKLENLDLALDDIGRAVEFAPGNAEALLERGIVRGLRGDAEGARADWQEILRTDEGSPAAADARENLERLAPPDSRR
ncbi:MAG: tetratricopeptide repeat protein [Rhodospirillaceae bacterium]